MYIVQYGAWNSEDKDDRVCCAEMTEKKDVINMYKEHVKKYKDKGDLSPVFTVWKGDRLTVKAKEFVSKLELAKFDYDYDEKHGRYNLPDLIMDDEES